jgi:F0F1-type ATP synthase membrane subunit b/b'
VTPGTEDLVDEKVLEELKFHQETIATDAHSPLHLIREKELEISGRVLASKREAEEIVAAARKKAVDIIAKAEDQGRKLAEKREKEVLAESERDVAKAKGDAQSEAEDLKTSFEKRSEAAAKYIVDTVMAV